MGLVFVVIPFMFMISTALKPQTYIFEMPPRLIPSEITLKNFIDAVEKSDFLLFFLNSALVTIVSTVSTVIVSAMMAYAFARLKFPGKQILFYLLLSGMMVPSVMLIIPQFIIVKQLNLLNTLPGLIFVYITMSLSQQTYLLRGFFEGIPKNLEEAALIDGAGRFQIFWRIILPLSKPGLATVTIFTFLYSWDEFPWAHVAIQETSKRTLPIAIALFQSQHLTQWGLVFAASLLALLPVLLVFIFFQRYFIQGIATTGIKE
ncbi:MAG: carbohydrate ABC transporter permease [Anaerolineales bacterium]|nr:carbohydrate ABC transporter permease [Anaerolineales bacterium]